MTTTYNNKALLFDDKRIDITAEGTFWTDIKCSNVIDRNTEVLEFNVPKNYSLFWDLHRSYIEIEAKVVNEDGSTIPNTESVGVINNLAHTLFRTQECTINHHQFGSNPNLHHIRCYWENLLGYSGDAKNSYLQAAMFYPDTRNLFNETDPVGGANTGLKDRLYFHQNSQIFKMAAAVHNDLFMQEKWFVSGTDINLKLYKSPDRFTVMNGNNNLNPRIEIVNANLKMCQVKLTDTAQNTIEKLLANKDIKYPTYVTTMQKFTVQSGNNSFTVDNIFPNRKLPEVIVVGFIRAASFNGDYEKNPLELKHENVASIGAYINDVATPQRPLVFNYDKNECIEGFMSLFTQFNTFGADKTHNIAYKDYAGGYTLYAFNLSPTAAGNMETTVPIARQGVVKLEVNFKTATSETLYMVVMGKTGRTLHVDKAREIQLK